MPRLLLMLALAVLVAGGGAGAWWFGMRGEPVPLLDDGGPTKPTPAQSEFVEMEPMSIPVMQKGRVTRLLTLVISLEVAGEGGLQKLAENRPRVRDAMLSELHALYAFRFVREGDNTMPLIKKRLLESGQEILGDSLRGVFVQAVQQRDTQT